MADNVQRLTPYDKVDMSGAEKYVKDVVVGATKIPADAKIQTLEGPLTVKRGDRLLVGAKGEVYANKRDFFSENYVPSDVEPTTFRTEIEAKLTKESRETLERLGIPLDSIKPFIKTTPVMAVELQQDTELETKWGTMKGSKGDYLMLYKAEKETLPDGKVVERYDRAICKRDEDTGLPLGYKKASSLENSPKQKSEPQQTRDREM